MASLAKRGLTVITSIHQPSSQVFALFHKLLLLDNGQVRYRKNAGDAAKHFEGMGCMRPMGYSDPDFIMELVTTQQLEHVILSTDHSAIVTFNQVPHLVEVDSRYTASWTEQVRVLTERQWTLFCRGDTFSAQTLCQFTGLSLLAGLLWIQLGTEEEDIFLRTALCLWIVGTWTFFPMFASMATFIDHAVILRKELSVGSYSLSAFFTAKTVAVLPLDWAWPVFYVTIVYWMTAPNLLFSAYLSVLGSTLLTVVAMQSVGLVISAGVPANQMVTVAVLIITFFFGYSGLFAPNMAYWLTWAEKLNLLVYAYTLHLRSIFTVDLTFNCKTPLSEYANCPAEKIRNESIFEEHNVKYSSSICVLVLVAASLLLRFISYRLLRLEYCQTEAVEYATGELLKDEEWSSEGALEDTHGVSIGNKTPGVLHGAVCPHADVNVDAVDV